jgi:hypothetical protein
MKLVTITLMAGVFGALFGAVSTAHAGCPSATSDGCDAVKNLSALIAGAPSCLHVVTSLNDCACDGEVDVHNDCSQNLWLPSFVFSECADANNNVVADCTVVEPGGTGTLRPPFPGKAAPGAQDESLELDLGGQALTLDVQYDVVHESSPGPGIGCDLGGAPPAGGPGAVVAAAGALWCVRRRRRARS